MSNNPNPLLPVPYLRDKYALVPRDPGTLIITAIAGATFAATTGGIIAAVAINIAISLALSLVTSALFGPKKPKPEDIKRELRRPSSLPFKRFCYGEFYAPGTPAPWRVKGNKLYGLLILNSRDSDGSNVAIRMDGRDVALTDTANLTDFASAGATAADAPFAGFCQFWLGLGDQTAPPTAFTTDAGDIFDATDAWAGLTVLFVILDAGPTDSRSERWPSAPPAIDVSMRWSKVWYPRDGAQGLASPATWAWSANQALCLLDAHTQNPLQPYQEGDLDIDGWEAAADIADQTVTLPDASTEPRYEAHGLLVFDQSEMHALLEPLFAAGAAKSLVIGGQTSIVPGAYQTPSITVADIVGAGFAFDTLAPVRDIANTIECTYRNEDRREESAELPPYAVSGAVAADGGIPSVQRLDLSQFVVSPYQAARCQVIAAHEARAQQRITGELPPELFNLTAGAGATVAMPDAPWDALDGIYQVEEITPSLEGVVVDDPAAGVAMRLPCVLREYSADWFTAADAYEPDIPVAEPIVSGVASTAAPASLTVTSVSVVSGGTTVSGALLEWPPVATEIFDYEVQFRPSGGDWGAEKRVGADVRDTSGDVFTQIFPLTAGNDYDFRVRANRLGRVSAWTTTSNVTIAAPANALSAPTNGSATGGVGQIDVTYTIPNEAGAKGITFYSGTADDTGTMTLLEGPIYSAPNSTVQITHAGLGDGVTRWYAARTIDEFGQESAFSSTVSGTTDPP